MEDGVDKMTHDKTRYWRDRMMDKLVSQNKQVEINLLDLVDNAEHIGVERKKFKKAINLIHAGFVEFEKVIMAVKL